MIDYAQVTHLCQGDKIPLPIGREARRAELPRGRRSRLAGRDVWQVGDSQAAWGVIWRSMNGGTYEQLGITGSIEVRKGG